MGMEKSPDHRAGAAPPSHAMNDNPAITKSCLKQPHRLVDEFFLGYLSSLIAPLELVFQKDFPKQGQR